MASDSTHFILFDRSPLWCEQLQQFEHVWKFESDFWPMESILEALQYPHNQLYVLCDTSQKSSFQTDSVLGFYMIHNVDVTSELLFVFIDPKSRGSGYGKSCLMHWQSHSRQLSPEISSWILEVRESNQAAINLYKQLGFEQYSNRKEYYQNKEDALLFSKRSTPKSKT